MGSEENFHSVNTGENMSFIVFAGNMLQLIVARLGKFNIHIVVPNDDEIACSFKLRSAK